jgi:hypothetical protein
MITCPQCGLRSQPTHLHCRKCGAKLDLSAVRFDGGPLGVARYWVLRVMRLVIFVGLLLVLGLILWPTQPQGETGVQADAYAALDAMRVLERGIEREQVVYRDFTEEGVNAYLQMRLGVADEGGEEAVSGEGNVKYLNVVFTDGGFAGHIEARWSFLRLTYAVEGAFDGADDGVRLVLDRLAIGHLPMPGPLRSLILRQMQPLVQAFELERYVLDHASRIEFREGVMRLQVSPRAREN